MNEVKITYETLFDLLRREKDKEELQQLDETFYSDVLKYLEQKMSFLKGSDTRGDLFGASENEKTRVQIINIKKIIKDLYERRQQKIIRSAINRSKVSSSLTNTLSMLPEEKVFFNEMVGVLMQNRESVLNKVLLFGNGNAASATVQRTEPEPEPKQESKPEEEKQEVSEKVEEPSPEENYSDDEDDSDEVGLDDSGEDFSEPEPVNEEPKQEEKKDDYNSRIKVRFKGAVPKFVGKKMEVYGPFEEGNEAELPEIIANILVNKEKAERM